MSQVKILQAKKSMAEAEDKAAISTKIVAVCDPHSFILHILAATTTTTHMSFILSLRRFFIFILSSQAAKKVVTNMNAIIKKLVTVVAAQVCFPSFCVFRHVLSRSHVIAWAHKQTVKLSAVKAQGPAATSIARAKQSVAVSSLKASIATNKAAVLKFRATKTVYVVVIVRNKPAASKAAKKSKKAKIAKLQKKLKSQKSKAVRPTLSNFCELVMFSSLDVVSPFVLFRSLPSTSGCCQARRQAGQGQTCHDQGQAGTEEGAQDVVCQDAGSSVVLFDRGRCIRSVYCV